MKHTHQTTKRKPKDVPNFSVGAPQLVVQIAVPAGRRPPDEQKVEALVDSIREIGLRNPIIVRHAAGKGDAEAGIYGLPCILVAGAHRLEACKRLGWKYVPVVDVLNANGDLSFGDCLPAGFSEEDFAALVEIDENLVRNELTAAERSALTDRRKQLYLKLHPETKPGVAGGRASGKARNEQRQSSATVEKSFAAETAKKTGKSERSVRVDAQIGVALNESPEVKEVIAGSKVENSKAALLEIAKAPKEKRVEVAKAKVEKSNTPKRKLHPNVEAKKSAAGPLIAAVVGTPHEQRADLVRDFLLGVEHVVREKAIAETIGAADPVRADAYAFEAFKVVPDEKRSDLLLELLGELSHEQRSGFLEEAVKAEQPQPTSTPIEVARDAITALSDDERRQLCLDLHVVDLEAVEALRLVREDDEGHKLHRKITEPTPDAMPGIRMLIGAADGVEVALAYLGLNWSSTGDEAKSRHRELAAQMHPDRGGRTEASSAVNRSYGLIKRWIEKGGK